MGIFDFITAPIQQMGQQAAQNVTGQSTAPPPSVVAPVPVSQPTPQSPFTNPIGWAGGAVNYVGQGIQNVSSGFQNIIQPAYAPIASAIQAAPAFIAGPVTLPVAIGGAIVGGVQSFLSPQPQIRSIPNEIGGGATYTPLLIPQYNEPTNPVSLSSRPGFYNPASLGDFITQKLANELYTKPYQVGTEQPFQSFGGAVNAALEIQRMGAYNTPTKSDDRFFLNELQKSVQSPVEASSAYHYEGMKSGNQVAANPFEYKADLSVELLKGVSAAKGFSPVSGEIGSSLPGGRGMQDFGWELAKGSNERVSFGSALSYVDRATNLEGPYGALYGGTGERYVTPVSIPTTQMSYVGGMLGIRASGLEQNASGLPAPFRSTYSPPTSPKQPVEFDSSRGILAGLLPSLSPEKLQAYQIANKNRPLEASLELQAAGFEGVKSTIGGVVSAFTFGLSQKGTIIEKGTEPQYSISETKSISGGNETISNMGSWLDTNRNRIDLYDANAVADYNAKIDKYNVMQKENPIIETTLTTKTPIPGTGIQDKVYEFGEWSKFVEGSGRVGRMVLGQTIEKQEAYYETIKNEPGFIGEAKRGVFFVGTELINKPAALAPAALQGATFLYGGGAIGGAVGSIAGGTGKLAPTAQWLMSPIGQTVTKAAVATGFGALYGWGVTEGFTATHEKTKENVYRSVPTLAAMYGGGGGFNWMGETKIVNIPTRSGATATGIAIGDQFFGGGRTPAGERYIGMGNSDTGFTKFTFGGETKPEPFTRVKPEPMRLLGEAPKVTSSTNMNFGEIARMEPTKSPLPQLPTRTEAFSYIQSRYPAQESIWNNYMTDTQMLGKKFSGGSYEGRKWDMSKKIEPTEAPTIETIKGARSPTKPEIKFYTDKYGIAAQHPRTNLKLEPMDSGKYRILETPGHLPEGTVLTTGKGTQVSKNALYYQSVIRPQFEGKLERTYGKPLTELDIYKSATTQEQRRMKTSERQSMEKAEKAYRGKRGSGGSGLTGNVFSPGGRGTSGLGDRGFAVSSGIGAGDQMLQIKSLMTNEHLSPTQRKRMALEEDDAYWLSPAAIKQNTGLSVPSSKNKLTSAYGETRLSERVRQDSRLTQEQRGKQIAAQMASSRSRQGFSVLSVPRTTLGVTSSQSMNQQQESRSRVASILSQAQIGRTVHAQETISRQQQKQESQSLLDPRSLFNEISIPRTITETAQRQTPTTALRIIQGTESRIIPKQNLIEEPRLIPKQPIIGFPGGFNWPGGQDQSPRPSKNFRKLREVINLRSQLWR